MTFLLESILDSHNYFRLFNRPESVCIFYKSICLSKSVKVELRYVSEIIICRIQDPTLNTLTTII